MHRAIRVESARSGARVQAFLLDTRQGASAVLIDHALRSAIRRRAEHAADARAYGMVLLDAAIGVGPAGRWQARILGNRRF